MKGNLLIVDDEADLVDYLHSLLLNFADKVFTAENGIKALEVLTDESIHCIVCDINMPGMNGVELIKKVRLQNQELPFIFYTGYGSRELMLEVVKYGAFDFLNKPHLNGIEDAVKRGLQVGAGTNLQIDESNDSFISEYQKLLKQITIKK